MPEDDANEMSFRALGRTLVAADGTPLGFCAIYFKENDKGEAVAIIVFYGGPNQYFMRKYLPMALRGMSECVQQLRDMGVSHAYAVCDERVPDADRFIQWAGGEKVENAEDPNGDVYVIYFDRMKLNRKA